MATKTVYCFTRNSVNPDRQSHSLFPATIEAIQQLGGTPVGETALEVDEADVADGRYFGAPNCNHKVHIPPCTSARDNDSGPVVKDQPNA